MFPGSNKIFPSFPDPSNHNLYETFDRSKIAWKYNVDQIGERLLSSPFFDTITFHCYEILTFPTEWNAITVKSYGVKNGRGEQPFADLIVIVFSSNLRSVKSFVQITIRRARETWEKFIRARNHLQIANDNNCWEIFPIRPTHLPGARDIFAFSSPLILRAVSGFQVLPLISDPWAIL